MHFDFKILPKEISFKDIYAIKKKISREKIDIKDILIENYSQKIIALRSVIKKSDGSSEYDGVDFWHSLAVKHNAEFVHPEGGDFFKLYSLVIKTLTFDEIVQLDESIQNSIFIHLGELLSEIRCDCAGNVVYLNVETKISVSDATNLPLKYDAITEAYKDYLGDMSMKEIIEFFLKLGWSFDEAADIASEIKNAC